LLRRPPRLVGGGRGGAGGRGGGLVAALAGPSGDPADAVVRGAQELRSGCLAVQGPPGSGKTHTAAATVVALASAGDRVGVTANSHAVIGNLLAAVVEAAEAAGLELRIAQRADAGVALDHPMVRRCSGSAEVEELLAAGEVDVVAGTAWLFCRAGMDGAVDHLVVDEAGQLSLANVLAMATAADNLVLVGDPRQLAQPSKGIHPPGAEASALGHLLDGASTVDPALGVLLDRTRRLHPRICSFVSDVAYDGRLHPWDGTALQRVGGDDALSGSGLRWAPVDHAGNRTASEEEADKVCGIYHSLLGRTWTDARGRERRIGPDDILVVAPYNAQVGLIAQCLPEGARVGTVDKFQGQEAAVAIVSMAASSGDRVSRGLEFLYSLNRLNVAVSRARALSVLVASPSLLTTPCFSVAQMRLVNAFCRFAEEADRV
ncbi:MAG TPA: DEAD/DEAH box helicase, partial [Acidimicrobiales bacterium]|nr:DEAD/DEAH box helicase [Acidimicrobiales bacterium]